MCDWVTTVSSDNICVIESQQCHQTISVWLRHNSVIRQYQCDWVTTVSSDNISVTESQQCHQTISVWLSHNSVIRQYQCDWVTTVSSDNISVTESQQCHQTISVWLSHNSVIRQYQCDRVTSVSSDNISVTESQQCHQTISVWPSHISVIRQYQCDRVTSVSSDNISVTESHQCHQTISVWLSHISVIRQYQWLSHISVIRQYQWLSHISVIRQYQWLSHISVIRQYQWLSHISVIRQYQWLSHISVIGQYQCNWVTTVSSDNFSVTESHQCHQTISVWLSHSGVIVSVRLCPNNVIKQYQCHHITTVTFDNISVTVSSNKTILAWLCHKIKMPSDNVNMTVSQWCHQTISAQLSNKDVIRKWYQHSCHNSVVRQHQHHCVTVTSDITIMTVSDNIITRQYQSDHVTIVSPDNTGWPWHNKAGHSYWAVLIGGLIREVIRPCFLHYTACGAGHDWVTTENAATHNTIQHTPPARHWVGLLQSFLD